MKLFAFKDQQFVAARNKISATQFFQDINVAYLKTTEADTKIINFYDDGNKLCNCERLLK